MAFPFQNSPKNLDPSSKMDLEFLGLYWKGKHPVTKKYGTMFTETVNVFTVFVITGFLILYALL